MDREFVDKKISEIASGVCSRLGFEFVHSELAGTKRNATVRVFIDKDGGLTIDDCADASRAIEAELDALDLIPDAYVLEVSSPGLERELYTIGDFRKFAGKAARLKLKSEINGAKSLKGTIISVAGDEIVFADNRLGEVKLGYDQVQKANLVFDISEDLGKK
ncbi:MAG TPA: ribosome maturation factor RimP [Blastocatellia bacterium]|nr:ribosome maturation factor RimP [Blastocatellia bacterium]